MKLSGAARPLSWEEHGTCARTETSKHVGIYNNKSAQRCVPHGFIELNIFVRKQTLRFGRTQCFREGFTQSFMNEAPGHLKPEEPGIKLATFQLPANPLYLLSHMLSILI